MLQSVRENMKGTVFIVVIMLFVIPMVLTGVNSSFLGSVAGTDAAVVEGESISNSDLARAIYLRRQSIASQTGADISADFLSDENLRPQVLATLTERAALVRTAEKKGMGVPDDLITKEIVQQEGFKTDNRFDEEKYRQLLRQNGYTPATYKNEVGSDILLGQQNFGLVYSSFVTDVEIDSLIKITEQKRDFYTVKIPQTVLKEAVSITEDEIQLYYDSQQSRFVDPEKVKVSYLELSVDELTKTIDVSDDDVRAQFDQEVEAFESNTQYEVSHILIENPDSEEAKLRVSEVQKKLSSGEDFVALVEAYSDDFATKQSGGSLGIMTQGMFPSEFEEAVLGLEEGQVSDAIETDSGLHIIRADKKIVAQAPTFEDREKVIRSQLARVLAEEQFVQSVDLLGELTFSAKDLSEASSQLGITIKQSDYFERQSGIGIALESSIRDAAYSSDVLGTDNNSKVLELGNDRAVVIRVDDHQEESIKSLGVVRDDIEKILTDDRKADALKLLASEFEEETLENKDAEALAKEKEYEFKAYSGVGRQDISVDREALQLAFSTNSLGNKPIRFESEKTADGYLIVAIQNIVDGKKADMDAQQLSSLKRQLSAENSSLERSSFESLIVAGADININN